MMNLSYKITSSLGLASCLALQAACGSSDPTGSGGSGRVVFTTWGEEYIEDRIPADPGDGDGFVDGWEVKYEKFLVNFQNIAVENAAGERAAHMPGSKLFDNHTAGVKAVVEFESVPARAWDRVSYEIAPVTASTELDASAQAADAEVMRSEGYGVYVAGTARKGEREKHFEWGFASRTRYTNCASEQDGREEEGIVVRNNARLEVQLTTHGDHLFYDRLQASSVPTIVTSLRFEALASADTDEDGEVTLPELEAQLIDVQTYNSAGRPAATYGAFVTELVRTVGHFRGEGECSVGEIGGS